MSFIDWLSGNYGNICAVICLVIGVASLLVKITPTQKDDAFLGKLIGWVDHLSIAKTAKDKEYIDLAKKQLKEE